MATHQDEPRTTVGRCQLFEAAQSTNLCGVRIMRTFVWSDERPDDADEIRSAELEQHVRYQGVLFQLRTSDTRHPAGEQRETEAIYHEAQKSGAMDLGLDRAE